jgi:hypothetical protein
MNMAIHLHAEVHPVTHEVVAGVQMVPLESVGAEKLHVLGRGQIVLGDVSPNSFEDRLGNLFRLGGHCLLPFVR